MHCLSQLFVFFNREQVFKSLSILDSMHTVRNAWDIVLFKTMSNCYKKCGLNFADEQKGLKSEVVKILGAFNVKSVTDDFTEEIITNEEERTKGTFLRYVSIDDNLRTLWRGI